VKCGKAGIGLSELLPQTGRIVDELTLVRSMKTDSVDHEAALRIIHSGKSFPGRPVWGSWVLYGLGTVRQNLPAYLVLSDPCGLPVAAPLHGRPASLPPLSQAPPSPPAGPPTAPPPRPADAPAAARQNQPALLGDLNAPPPRPPRGTPEREARIRHYELAAQM